MATSDLTNGAALRSVTPEKPEEVQHEYCAQDESAETTINRSKREDALRRKLDLYIAPVMMMLMLISYLDRGNIGFAATQGMTTDIGLKGSELNVCTTCDSLPCNVRGLTILPDCCLSILHFLHPRRGELQ
jgi:hypothetical protein